MVNLTIQTKKLLIEDDALPSNYPLRKDQYRYYLIRDNGERVLFTIVDSEEIPSIGYLFSGMPKRKVNVSVNDIEPKLIGEALDSLVDYELGLLESPFPFPQDHILREIKKVTDVAHALLRYVAEYVSQENNQAWTAQASSNLS